MAILVSFGPILLFVAIFFGSGLYFSLSGMKNAFYILPPTAAIMPSIVVAWLMNRSSADKTMRRFLNGAAQHDIITMCMIFLLAGALSSVTQTIGSMTATVNCTLTIIPKHFMLIGVFLIGGLISTAIGTSMGTIAALGVIVTELANRGAFPLEIGVATLVSGSMFGDNMSLISDTTIAAVSSQNADFKSKLKLNALVASISSVITIGFLLLHQGSANHISHDTFSFILISPYILLILLAVLGVNAFVTLAMSILYSGVIGIFFTSQYSWLALAQDIAKGFANMQEIMMLSILIGGLSGLSRKNETMIIAKLLSLLPKNAGRRAGQLLISLIVSVFDILLANNTIAIIFSGPLAKEIAEKCKIKPYESATWLDIYSCVFQGIIPYSAQVLLVSAMANISPLNVVSKVYYCYILAIVSFIYIMCAGSGRRRK
ncbi:NhaC Na+/H+ antiporter family protein [Rickettsiales endosymbiont of Paramecium tredecaurelia]|uniref:Na+/H+ antiporter NhaC family protein n=1 Tax=Candidatus Sarmatiella mevalonica TaxID=2770581 RepID=UPI001923C670|nr:Na+/H+ antiporter NhaC family protein [Candidatus Sarmatiella mevalonica]MBL3284399.1 NhaC Na+/H+ antiporter family protein [Candidatus Sarmatiella mevalonica]